MARPKSARFRRIGAVLSADELPLGTPLRWISVLQRMALMLA